MAFSKIIAESMDLTDTYNFTGTLQQNGAGIGGANTPFFKAYNNSGFSFSSSSTTKMRMNVVAFESNSGSFSTTNYNFTVPANEGGKYFCHYSFYLNSATNARGMGYIFVNNTERLFNEVVALDDYSAVCFLQGSGIVNVSAGDTIDCRAYYNAGSPELEGNTYTDGRFSYFEGFKIIE